MKTQILSKLTLFIALTAVIPVWAQSSISTKMEATPYKRLSDFGTRVNPQLGVSSFDYSEGKSTAKARFSGGTTFEFGEGSRRLETGLLYLATGASIDGSNITSDYLTIPMAAKLRLVQLRSQEWYLKLGAMTAFELTSNADSKTNDIDVLGLVGLSGRLAFSRQADFVIETTYNRGLIDAVRSSNAGTTYNQGFLVLVGLSLKI